MNEPDIIVNGVRLTVGQAMTVRVALGNFVMDLQANGLGDDEHGKVMKYAYVARANEIFKMMNI